MLCLLCYAFGYFEFVIHVLVQTLEIYVLFEGVYKCRAGWASLAEPQLVFKNITAKQKGKKVHVIYLQIDRSVYLLP